MIKNNYDINSKGINVEVVCYYDTKLSRMFFNDNFLRISEGIYFYYSYGEFTFDNTKNYNKYISKGYSQGDIIKVLIPQELDSTKTSLREQIDNILWDSPIYLRITINEKEIEGCDLLEDEYKYNKNSVIEKLKTIITGDELKEVVLLLPENPEYL